MKKSYMLSLPEFYLMVGKAGRSSVFGFLGADNDSCSERYLVSRVNKMVRAGLIKANPNGLSPRADLWNIICNVSNAKKCIVFNFADPLKDTICCYIGENIIVTNMDANTNGKTVRLMKMNKDDFVLFCKDLLSHDDLPFDATAEFEESDTVDYLRKNGFKMKVSDLIALDEVVWVVDEYCSINGILKKRTCLLDNVPCAQILKLSDESFAVLNSSQDDTERFLESFDD